MNFETTSSPSRDASQDGLVTDDSRVFPMFARKEDSDAWLRNQEEKRRLAAEHDARASIPSLADLIKRPQLSSSPDRLEAKWSRTASGEYAATVSYSFDRRAALRVLHRLISSMPRAHIFASHDFPPGPHGPMADDCRGFVGLKWRLVL